MSDEVNFLPQELRSKKKREKSAEERIEYVAPINVASKDDDIFSIKKSATKPTGSSILSQSQVSGQKALDAHQEIVEQLKDDAFFNAVKTAGKRPFSDSVSSISNANQGEKQFGPNFIKNAAEKNQKTQKMTASLQTKQPESIDFSQPRHYSAKSSTREKTAQDSVDLLAFHKKKKNSFFAKLFGMFKKEKIPKADNLISSANQTTAVVEKQPKYEEIKEEKKENLATEKNDEKQPENAEEKVLSKVSFFNKLKQILDKLLKQEEVNNEHRSEVDERSYNLRTNLVKSLYVYDFDSKSLIRLQVIGVIASVVVVAAVHFGLIFYSSTIEYESSDDNLTKKEQEFKDLQKKVDDLGDFRTKVSQVKELLSDHIYWTKFFNYLEKYTMADVFYANFNGNTSGPYDLNSRAKSYEDAARQMALWEVSEPFTKNVAFSNFKYVESFKDVTAVDEYGEEETTLVNESYVEIGIILDIDASIFKY
ncbi:MAG: hypothetical protein Q8Q23_05665 [bacterium]|nr:hypothetical protein [bacterium]